MIDQRTHYQGEPSPLISFCYFPKMKLPNDDPTGLDGFPDMFEKAQF